MKTKGMLLILLGVLGSIFVLTFDVIAGKPVNDITGPKSIFALLISGVSVIAGIRCLLKSPKKE